MLLLLLLLLLPLLPFLTASGLNCRFVCRHRRHERIVRQAVQRSAVRRVQLRHGLGCGEVLQAGAGQQAAHGGGRAVSGQEHV